MDKIVVLGIHDGHNSGASLIVDGFVVASVSEERLTRVKNEIGYPKESIKEVLSISGIDISEITSVVFASSYMHTKEYLSAHQDWYKKGTEDHLNSIPEDENILVSRLKKRQNERVDLVTDQLCCSPSKVSFVDHHLAHAAAAYYGSPFEWDEDVLIFTCDGSGDGISATVSVGSGINIRRISSTPREASIGKIYSRVTYALGLNPWEHEYKVMGLAPYAHQINAERLSSIFYHLVGLDNENMSFTLKSDIDTSHIYDYLLKNLERKRFDEIAGSVQIFTENMLSEWVQSCIARTGIRNIVCGGGVFMNVKANMQIANLPSVDKMFVFPSCGDESLSFGAAWLEYYKLINERYSSEKISKKKLSDVYLGREWSHQSIISAIDRLVPPQGISVSVIDDMEGEIAHRLANDKIVARFSGRMEWGARALGNRSILANPKNWSNVERINSMIKMRDFWMPFAPSILQERQKDYIKNEKSMDSPYMMLAFETTSHASSLLGAAIHPRDRTARAQLVSQTANPQYHSLISKFSHITGIGAILNTSFNLHGFPLVNSPDDAIDVFIRSGLDCLALGNCILTK